MSEDISADAVPIEDHDRRTPSALEIITEPTLARHSADQNEESCCSRMENIGINNGDNASEESLPMVEPMAESSDSNDSNGGGDPVEEYQKVDNKSNSTRENNRQNQIQNQIIIQNPTGIVHLGPTYNISVGQAFTQVNANAGAANTPQTGDQNN